MRRFNVSWIAVVLLMYAGFMLITTIGPTAPASAQEEKEEVEAREESEKKTQFEQLERRLDEIQQEIDQAEQRGEEDRIRKLRREGERLLDQLEALERAREEEEEEDGHEWEAEIRELEMQRLALEVERLHQELEAGRQQAALHLARIAADHGASAAYAISRAIDQLEEEAAIDFLAELKQDTDNGILRRIIRHQLVTLRLHADQPEEAREELRYLILGK